MTQQFSTRCMLAVIKALSLLPQTVSNLLTRLIAFVMDRSKGNVARATIKLALPDADKQTVNTIAKQAAYHSCGYVLSLSCLHKISYQLHDLDVVISALDQNKGLIITSLHMAPPNIVTLVSTREGVKVSTVIGKPIKLSFSVF